MGRGQSRRLRPRRRGCQQCGARGRSDRALRGDRSGGARAPAGTRHRARARARAGHEPRDRRCARRGPGARVADGEVPEGVRVHLKLDTGMGRWGIAELDVPSREVVGPDESLRLCGLRHRVHRAAGRPVQGGDGALSAPDAPHREQRRRTRLSRSPLRRGALRHRALRHLSLRHRPSRGRAGARAPLGFRARAGEAPAARASRPGTADAG